MGPGHIMPTLALPCEGKVRKGASVTRMPLER
jgi:hypothetical protein